VPLLTYFLNGWMMGWASAPYDPRWAMNNPRPSALVSLAGPLANLGVVLAVAVVIRVGIMLNFFSPPGYMSFTTVVSASQDGAAASVAVILSILFSLNVLLFSFNLLPFPPLDGSGVVQLFFKDEESAVKYMNFIQDPALSLIGILAAWRLFEIIFSPIHRGFINGLYWGLISY
jgi:Zn-dependent protease